MAAGKHSETEGGLKDGCSEMSRLLSLRIRWAMTNKDTKVVCSAPQ